MSAELRNIILTTNILTISDTINEIVPDSNRLVVASAIYDALDKKQDSILKESTSPFPFVISHVSAVQATYDGFNLSTVGIGNTTPKLKFPVLSADATILTDANTNPPEYTDFGIPTFNGKQYADMLTSNVLNWSASAATTDSLEIDMTHSVYPLLSVVNNNMADGGNAGNTHTSANVVEIDYTESYLSSAKFRIPTVIQTNSGRLIASYDIRWNSHNDISKTPYNDQCTGFSYSDDNGKTWTKLPAFLMGWYYEGENGYVQSGVSDPSLLYDDENDVVFCFAIAGNGTQSQTNVNQAQIKDARRTQLVMSYSIDNGETWSKPEIVTDKIFDSDGISQSWICTADNPTGKFGFIFGCCSNGIRLKHQQNSNNNGLALAIQLWPANGLYGLSSTRCTFAHFYPTYQIDRFGNKKATAKFVLTEGLIGEICAYFCKSMTTVSNVCLRIFTTTDCGKTWTCKGNTAGTLDGDKVFSQIANTPTTRVKPSIAYSDYMHRWFISYSNYTNRGCPTIRYADGEITDSTIWKVFDVCDFSTQSAGYTNLISLNNGTSIGMIYESHLDSCSVPENNSKSFMYNSYSFLPKVQTLFSSTWREIDPYGTDASLANDKLKAMSFQLSDFTDTKFAKMKVFSYRGQNSSSLPSGYENIETTKIAIYDSNKNLIIQNGHKAISKPMSWNIDGTSATNYAGRKYEFVFEYPVMLKQGQTYYVIQYADDVEYSTYDEYKTAFQSGTPYFLVTLLKTAPVNGQLQGVIAYNSAFAEIKYTRDPGNISRRYCPLCQINTVDNKTNS